MGGENQLDGRREKDTELLQIKDSTRYKNMESELVGTTKENNHRFGKVDSFTRPFPQLYARKDDCCGCAACYAVCPIKEIPYSSRKTDGSKSVERYGLAYRAISMEEDDEGFLYPVVDAELCVRCYKCVDVCPIKMADAQRDI